MGRPKKSPEAARTARIHIRVTPAYREWLEALANELGDATATGLLVRLAGEEAERREKGPPPDR